MNGYFQLINNQDGTGLRLIPPTEGGEPININEIMEYLGVLNIPYDSVLISKSLRTMDTKDITVMLTQTRAFSQPETAKILVSDDRMKAYVRFYPESSDGNKMNEEELIADLEHKKIKFGIDRKVIQNFVKKREYCKTFLIAVGKPPRHGTDGRIEYMFNTDLKARPTVKEDGSVDFFNLNLVNHCNAGDLLAKLIPEDPGEAGKNVLGEPVKARDVKRPKLEYGRNIAISEDRLRITSESSGHVTLVEGKVFVSNVLEVENVDNSTGNIEYEGNVEISGNVCSNFSVHAKGSVEVKGVVEGAEIIAGGNIVIARGMNGMSKGVIHAGGNIIAKFIENATATADGYVQCGSILHSKVLARTEIHVDGKRGFITGGTVCATNLVNVKTLGSPMGADTIVDVGVNPTTKLRYQDLQKQLQDANKAVKSIMPVLQASLQKLSAGGLSAQQKDYIKSLSEAYEQKKKEIESCTAELEKLQKVLESSGDAQVIVRGEVYPGTKIIISDATMVVKKNMKYCKFVKSAGDVKMAGI